MENGRVESSRFEAKTISLLRYRTLMVTLAFVFLNMTIDARGDSGRQVSTERLVEAFVLGLEEPHYRLSIEELRAIGEQLREAALLYETKGQVELEKAFENSQKLFADGRIQEGIWFLEDLGFFSEAEFFSTQFESNLRSKPLVAGAFIGTYLASEPRWGKAGNFPVVIKSEDRKWIGAMFAEAWVYQLDRIIGLNIVPLTFIGQINGFDYSAQVLIRDSVDSGIEFRMTGYSGEFPAMFVLDFLIWNRDRHYKNSIISSLGQLVAIDNGHTAAIQKYQEGGNLWRRLYPHYAFEQLPRNNLVRTIQEVSIEQFRKEFSRYASKDVVDVVTENLKILAEDFKKIPPRGVYRPIESDTRMEAKEPLERLFREFSCRRAVK